MGAGCAVGDRGLCIILLIRRCDGALGRFMVVVVTRCLRCDDGCMIDGLMWGSADECRLKCDDDIRAFCIWPIFTEIKKKKKKRSCRVRACLAVRRFRLPRPRAGDVRKGIQSARGCTAKAEEIPLGHRGQGSPLA